MDVFLCVDKLLSVNVQIMVSRKSRRVYDFGTILWLRDNKNCACSKRWCLVNKLDGATICMNALGMSILLVVGPLHLHPSYI